MGDELNEAGARGYRVAGAQGGETAFGGNEAVVIMALDPEGRRFRYILLAPSRTGAMQEELNEVPPEYELVAMTVFSATFGGSEAAAILEAEIAGESGGVAGACGRFPHSGRAANSNAKGSASGNDNAGRSETMATAASFSSVVLSWGHGVKSRLAQQPVDGEERQYNTASH